MIYLCYIFVSFDVGGLISKAQPGRALLLATDAVAHKVHVTRNLRGTKSLTVAVEGERTATYDTPPDWVEQSGDVIRVNLGKGVIVEMKEAVLTLTVPDYGRIRVEATGSGIETDLPEGKAPPDWLRATSAKFDARPSLGQRIQVSRTRMELHRYFGGWEHFSFPSGRNWPGLLSRRSSDWCFQRPAPAGNPNWKLIFDTIWNNPDWQHGNVFIALLETFLMAVLGTLTAALAGLPLAVLAASNFTPSQVLRFAVRRIFDFLRGIDMLIWSLIFIRAFGLGPLTGALAIAFTDTGTLGKLFSEALENVNKQQMEGVSATGANRWQFYRVRGHSPDYSGTCLPGPVLPGVQHPVRHYHRGTRCRRHRPDAGGNHEHTTGLGKHRLPDPVDRRPGHHYGHAFRKTEKTAHSRSGAKNVKIH